MAAIAILGGGAIGCFYGAQFITAGHDVRLLLRREYERARQGGLTVRQERTSQIASTQTMARLDVPPSAFRACRMPADCLHPAPPDVVILTVKTTAVADLPGLLAPFAALSAPVVALCNGIGFEDHVARVIDPRRIVGALAFICVNREDDGAILHQAHGQIELGPYRDGEAVPASVADMFRGSGIATRVAASLAEARWRKLTWNIPFNGVSATADVDTDVILRDPALHALAEKLMREVIAIANADAQAEGRQGRIDAVNWIPELFNRTAQMGRYLTSTLLDVRHRRPLEIEFMFCEPIRRAQRLGIPVPELTGIAAKLKARDG